MAAASSAPSSPRPCSNTPTSSSSIHKTSPFLSRPPCVCGNAKASWCFDRCGWRGACLLSWALRMYCVFHGVVGSGCLVLFSRVKLPPSPPSAFEIQFVQVSSVCLVMGVFCFWVEVYPATPWPSDRPSGGSLTSRGIFSTVRSAKFWDLTLGRFLGLLFVQGSLESTTVNGEDD